MPKQGEHAMARRKMAQIVRVVGNGFDWAGAGPRDWERFDRMMYDIGEVLGLTPSETDEVREHI